MTVTVDWQQRAACRGMDLRLFFPRGGPGGRSRRAAAKAVCRQCPVRSECLEWALAHERGRAASHRAGIWGGLTGWQRWRLERCRAGRCRCRIGKHQKEEL